MNRVDIILCDVPMYVEFDYFPGESISADNPGTPDEFEVTYIEIGGVDCTDLLIDDFQEKIIEKICEG